MHFSGDDIHTKEKITIFLSGMGNHMILYAKAVGENKTLFLNDHLKINKMITKNEKHLKRGTL